MAQCSNIFIEAFDSRGAGCERTCACGKVYFDGINESQWDWAEGELETLRCYAKLHPDEYFEVDGAIGTLVIDGKSIVIGCSCDLAERYERFIVQNSEKLAKYLNKRVEELKSEAERTAVQESID